MTERYQQSLDDIRGLIELYVKKVANLKDQKGEGVGILHLRSEIEAGLSYYRSKGAFLDPEETRLSNYDTILQKQAHLLVKMIGKRLFAQERDNLHPPAEQWWWQLDVLDQNRQKKALKKNLTTLILTFTSLFLIYFFLLRLPPNEKQYLDLNSSIEKLIDQSLLASDSDQLSLLIDKAMQQSEEAKAIFPERPIPYIIQAALLEKTGQTQKAQPLFNQARQLYARSEDYLLDRAMWYFRLNMINQAKDSLELILADNPESIGALNLLGTIYENENNFIEALKAYNKVLELAEKQNQQNIIPVMKIKIAMLQLRLPMSMP